ncbi:MAG: hypothetical protein QOG62_1871 [Thermoleophilaceae bacterium]|nr:hypothetical protein [Thermoleophilaceae bacterium]
MAVAFLVLLLLASAAAADDDLKIQSPDSKVPAGYRLTVGKVKKIASQAPPVKAQKKLHQDLAPTAYTRKQGDWQVSWFSHHKELAQVYVSDDTEKVTEAWTGPQIAWKMARGYPGAFGRKVNAWYIWIPLCVLFVAPFFDPRRPFRMLHLDLLVVVAGFGISHYFFNLGQIDISVPLAYPPLLYLLARGLWIGFRPTDKRERLVPLVPITWLVIAILFLVGFRVALNAADSNVIDVGYAGVIGADRIMDGDGIYGEDFNDDVGSGDTYGPADYLAYVPFEQAVPWSGTWDDLPAAHGASVAFDLAVLLGLFVLGGRLRDGPEGRDLGIALAFAWAALPYSAFSLESNSNDSLVAAFLVWALVAVASPAGRGAFIALATATKFAPVGLGPLFLRGATSMDGSESPDPWRRGRRGALVYCLMFVVVTAVVFLPFIPDGGVREIFDRTIGYQAGRDSPFSIWGEFSGLGWLHVVIEAAAVALALVVAFVPWRRTPVQVAALGVAVIVALQLTVNHWFYLYVVWFAPFLLVALFTRYRGRYAPGP